MLVKKQTQTLVISSQKEVSSQEEKTQFQEQSSQEKTAITI
jgi:hypothetical protein